MSTLVSRDVFVRAELRRERAIGKTCLWCGQPGRWRYFIETDGGRKLDDRTPLSGIMRSGPFCGVECFRAYNGR